MLTASNIRVSFKKENQKKLFGRERQEVVRDASFTIDRGQCIGFVGESGSGKSTLGRVICGLLKPDSGEVKINGETMYGKGKRPRLAPRKMGISIVFQDYISSVNPRFRIRDALLESLNMLGEKMDKKTAEGKMADLLEQVGLDVGFLDRYPHELSGGQLQRVCIARAVALDPDIIVLDEAISSLDAATQKQVMDLLIKLKERHNFSYFFITHDLTAVTYICDQVMFFEKGRIVEHVDTIENLPDIKNPYAKKLMSSVLGLDSSALRAVKNEI